MKRQVFVLVMSVVWAYGMGAASAGPATAPSGTAHATRVVKILWDAGVPTPDLAGIARETRQAAARIAGEQLDTPNGASHVKISLETQERACTVTIAVDVSQPDRLAAAEAADAIVEAMQDRVQMAHAMQFARPLDEARRQIETLESQRQRLTSESDDFRKLANANAQQMFLSSDAVAAAAARLQDERQHLELDLAGLQARKEGLTQAIAELSEKVKTAAGGDAIATELETVVAQREKLLSRTKQLVATGQGTEQEAAAAIAALAEAKARLAERRRDAAAGAGGDVLSQWARDLANLAIDVREKQVRQEVATKALKQLQEVSARQSRADEIARRAADTQRQLDDARATMARLQDRIGLGQPPVVLLQSGEDLTPHEAARRAASAPR